MATNEVLLEYYGYELDPTIFPSLGLFDARQRAQLLHERLSVSFDIFEALKPLEMTDVAGALGLSVGTVSRAVSGKWMQTPRGMVELRKFFSGGVETADGGNASWEAVRQMVKDVVDARELDLLAVKGKEKPVTVYEVLAKKGEVPPQVKAALAHYEPALAQFRARDFAGARERFQQALAVRPDDGPSKTYVERCTYFLEHPPEAGWDGVWHMKEK